MTECWSKWIATTWMDQLNPLIASSESQMATDVSLHRRLMINHDNGGHYIVRTRTVKEKLKTLGRGESKDSTSDNILFEK